MKYTYSHIFFYHFTSLTPLFVSLLPPLSQILFYLFEEVAKVNKEQGLKVLKSVGQRLITLNIFEPAPTKFSNSENVFYFENEI